MKFVTITICCLALAARCFPQNTFSVIGTPIPSSLAQQNYGNLPKGIVAYDLNICNTTALKQSVVSGEIYQALSNANGALRPIGREIILPAILRNQNRNILTILNIGLNSALTVLSALSSSNRHLPSGFVTASALASVSEQQILANFKPVLPASQFEQFETQVLQPALVLDGGSCVERTIFAATSSPKSKPQNLNFHVR